MSVKQSGCAWEARIDASSKLVLLAIADHANNDGVCWPGIEYIVYKTCLSRRTVLRQLKKLESDGYITVQKQYIKNGQRLRNVYILHTEEMINNEPKCQPDTPPYVSSCHPPMCHGDTGEPNTLYNMNRNKEPYIVDKEQKKNKVQNVQISKLWQTIFGLVDQLPDTVGPYAIELEKAWLKVMVDEYVTFQHWWKLYHTLLRKKPQGKQKCQDVWKKLKLEEKEGLVLATIFEFIDKKIESDQRKEPAMVKMALTFIRNAELQDTGLMLNSTRNALNDLTTLQQRNGGYRNGYQQSSTNQYARQIHETIPQFCTTGTNYAA